MTPEQLTLICPSAASWADPLIAAFAQWRIDTPLRQTAALAQFAHESGCFKHVEENLYYSAEGLMRVFPTHFADFGEAQQFAKQPERIANRVYGGRMGNGSEASGEGWTYRGRGICQLTGKANYTRASLAIYGDDRLVKAPELLELPQAAAASAGWFWDTHRLSQWADLNTAEGFRKVTLLINGSDASNAARALIWRKARQAFGLPVI